MQQENILALQANSRAPQVLEWYYNYQSEIASLLAENEAEIVFTVTAAGDGTTKSGLDQALVVFSVSGREISEHARLTTVDRCQAATKV